MPRATTTGSQTHTWNKNHTEELRAARRRYNQKIAKAAKFWGVSLRVFHCLSRDTRREIIRLSETE